MVAPVSGSVPGGPPSRLLPRWSYRGPPYKRPNVNGFSWGEISPYLQGLYLAIRGTLQLWLRGPKIPRRLRRWGDAESRAGGCRCVDVLGFGAKEHSEEDMTPVIMSQFNATFLLLQVFFRSSMCCLNRGDILILWLGDCTSRIQTVMVSDGLMCSTIYLKHALDGSEFLRHLVTVSTKKSHPTLGIHWDIQ